MAAHRPPVTRRLAAAALLLGIAGVWLATGERSRGREPAEAPARRVVSLVPAVTEMIFAVGGGGRLVGVSSFDAYPPEVERLVRVGALLDPDLERILSLRPDLVVAYGSQESLQAQLEEAGIAVFSYRHGGLAHVTATVRAIGARLGMASEADEAAGEIESALQNVRARVAGRPRPRTLLVFGRERGALRAIYASGGRGFLHDILELAGGEDVLGHVARENVQTSVELILGLAPEVIIELHGGDPLGPEEAARERRVWDGLPGVPAVQRGRVYIMSGQELVVPGPRVTRAAERFAKALHPDAFDK